MKAILLLQISTVVLSFSAHAHKNHVHDVKPEEKKIEEKSVKYEEISRAYEAEIKPIFQKKCFDCHSQNPHLPWYSSIPGAKGMISSDIKEAKKHLDMTGGFPFKGHGTSEEDLQAIKDAAIKRTMPPQRYKIMHWGSSLTSDEITKVKEWADQSLSLLKKKD